LGRGTQIVIHLKEDAKEYLKESRLKDLVSKYSEFINFPIYLWSSKTVTEEVPDLETQVCLTFNNEAND
jgi:heat shock protein beta